MTKEEFFSQMAKVMEKPEAKKAAEEAATPQALIEAAALAGVTFTEKDLQEAAAWKESGEELDDSELDRIIAAGGTMSWDIENKAKEWMGRILCFREFS